MSEDGYPSVNEVIEQLRFSLMSAAGSEIAKSYFRATLSGDADQIQAAIREAFAYLEAHLEQREDVTLLGHLFELVIPNDIGVAARSMRWTDPLGVSRHLLADSLAAKLRQDSAGLAQYRPELMLWIGRWAAAYARHEPGLASVDSRMLHQCTDLPFNGTERQRRLTERALAVRAYLRENEVALPATEHEWQSLQSAARWTNHCVEDETGVDLLGIALCAHQGQDELTLPDAQRLLGLGAARLLAAV